MPGALTKPSACWKVREATRETGPQILPGRLSFTNVREASWPYNITRDMYLCFRSACPGSQVLGDETLASFAGAAGRWPTSLK